MPYRTPVPDGGLVSELLAATLPNTQAAHDKGYALGQELEADAALLEPKTEGYGSPARS